MSNSHQNLNKGVKDWTIGFRIGLIGFVLFWAITAHGDELAPVPVQSKTGNDEGLPVLIVPSENNAENVSPSDNADHKPGQLIPVPGDKASESVKEEPVQGTETESSPKNSWTIVIHSGPSSVAGTEQQREAVTFPLNDNQQVDGLSEVHPLGVDQTTTGGSHSVLPQKIDPAQYKAYYESIPFSRTEYLANPSYRHEAAMEMMFKQLRPTTIHKQDKPVRVYNQPPMNEGPVRHINPAPWPWYNRGYGPAPYGWNYHYPYTYWPTYSTYHYNLNRYGSLYWRYYRPLGY